MPTFVVGIDLGTTNSVLAYVPLEGDRPQVELLPIPQLVAPGTVEPRTMLPSFLYLAPPHEAGRPGLDLPGQRGRRFGGGRIGPAAGGRSAGPHGGGGQVLAGLQPRGPPPADSSLGAPAEVAKVSPVTASRRYLEHLVAAWEAAFPDAPLAQQQVVLTVPASFDAAARELTREAALAAGLPEDLVLLEEPQAAAYAWLADHGRSLAANAEAGRPAVGLRRGRRHHRPDAGRRRQEAGELMLERLAVGNHLLVGGDNMDLALAHHVAGRLRRAGRASWIPGNRWPSGTPAARPRRRCLRPTVRRRIPSPCWPAAAG